VRDQVAAEVRWGDVRLGFELPEPVHPHYEPAVPGVGDLDLIDRATEPAEVGIGSGQGFKYRVRERDPLRSLAIRDRLGEWAVTKRTPRARHAHRGLRVGG
jgi:hypothetical protein